MAWREQIAREKRAAFRDEEYWGRPVPGFGDPAARVLVLGLAPAAHGGNRTGRVFTGDRSGDWLFAAMHRAGFANQPESVALDDGLRLTDAYVAAAVRCAPPDNKPTREERDTCLPYFARELALLERVRVIVTLGAFAYEALWGVLRADGVELPRPRPKFAHGVEVPTAARDDHRLLPPQPAEHLHRQAHRADARRRVRPRPRAQPDERDELHDAVDDRDRPEHAPDRDAQRAVRRADREVRADAGARDRGRPSAGARRASRCRRGAGA